VGLSPGDITKCFFSSPNPSSRTMALGVDAASKRNEYKESSWGVKRGRRVRLTTYGPPRSVPGLALPLVIRVNLTNMICLTLYINQKIYVIICVKQDRINQRPKQIVL
jgi:hypothetical protein